MTYDGITDEIVAAATDAYNRATIRDASPYGLRAAINRVAPMIGEYERSLAENAKEERDQIRYERRLLAVARMTLDLVAAGGPERWDQARREAEQVSQWIVDEIGHLATDEPALGPHYREQLAQAIAERDEARRVLAAICDCLEGASHDGYQPWPACAGGCRWISALAGLRRADTCRSVGRGVTGIDPSATGAQTLRRCTRVL